MYECVFVFECEVWFVVDVDELRKGFFFVFYDEFEFEEYRSVDGGVFGVMRVLYDVLFFFDVCVESVYDGLILCDYSF